MIEPARPVGGFPCMRANSSRPTRTINENTCRQPLKPVLVRIQFELRNKRTTRYYNNYSGAAERRLWMGNRQILCFEVERAPEVRSNGVFQVIYGEQEMGMMGGEWRSNGVDTLKILLIQESVNGFAKKLLNRVTSEGKTANIVLSKFLNGAKLNNIHSF